jgi:hypothetical protein
MRKTKKSVVSRPVEGLIHMIRGQRVMLDRDLAGLYEVRPIALRQQVKRNKARFPADFMFHLTPAEAEALVSQSVIPSRRSLGGALPYVFTEHGVAMLSAVLHSARATEMSIAVIRAFVRLRELVATNKDIATRVEKLERSHDRTASVIEVLVEDIDRLGRKVERFKQPSPYSRRRIGYITEDNE